MSDTKLRPEDLTVEERAWCDRMAAALCSSGNYTAEGAIDEAVNFGLKKRRALFGQPKGESESCPNCGETTSRTHSRYAGPGPDKWTCQPAPPEPAATVAFATPEDTERERQQHEADMENMRRNMREPAAREMPEAVRKAIQDLHDWADTYEADLLPREITYTRSVADALEREWRNLAQPVAVGMTEELEHVLSIAERDLCYKEECFDDSARTVPDERIERLRAAIAAVREQAGNGRKVELGKVREFFDHCGWFARDAKIFRAALAELDAAEGKGEGRG